MNILYVRIFDTKKIILIIGFMMILPLAFAQFIEEYKFPQDEFSLPLEIPLRLSGTFGEPRGNHFHAGIDLKTNGSTGQKVFSIADGFVSRVKISPYGYGKALYINHANGYTSVYAHLEKFSDTLNLFIKNKQYATQSFEQDLYFEPGQFPVSNGELIGVSGNSGGSAGPHLHFEIRHASSQIPINPLLFGYQIEDNKLPFSGYVRVKNVDNGVYETDGELINLIQKDTLLTSNKKITVEPGKIAVAVHAYDQQSHSTNKNGVFRMKMKIDDKIHFQWTADEIPFDQGRYVNALMDYKDKTVNGLSMHQCFVLPKNELSIYEIVENNGYFTMEIGQPKKIDITIFDFSNNKTHIQLQLEGDKNPSFKNAQDNFWKPDDNQSIITENFRAHFPSGIFYDQVKLNFTVDSTEKKHNYAFEYKLHDEVVPLHKYVVVEIKPNKNILQKDKVVIREKLVEGGQGYLKAYWNGEYVCAKTRSLGSYSIQIDTISPDLKLLNYSAQSKTFRDNSIRIHGKDDMSGLKKCEAFIDEQWILLDYDAKRNLFIYHFDEYCPKGEHNLLIIAEDEVGNIFKKSYSFKN